MSVLIFSLMAAGCATTPEQPKMHAGTEPAARGCDSPLGFIAEGRTATGYLHSIEQNGQSCLQGVLTCDDGKWSGAFIYPSCTRVP